MYNPSVSRRDRNYRTEAVVLRRQDLGEADRILTVFTPDMGKRRLVAKGVRRPGSRKAGHLEPFVRVQLMVSRGRELDLITQAEAIDLYPHLQLDLLRLGHAAYAAELLDRFSVEEQGGRGLFDLLAETLGRLESGADPGLALRAYEIRLLELVGYRPELSRCLGCGTELQPVDQFFSAEEGGVLCQNCGPLRPMARSLSLRALKVLRHLQRSQWEQAADLRLGPAVATEVERTLEGYLSYLLERRLNAPDFLRRVRALLRGNGDSTPAALEAEAHTP
jgi:DNA repair protein RecO (recombination protein O)